MLRCSIPLYKENLMKLIKETKNNYRVLGLVEARKLLKESISKLAENENYQLEAQYITSIFQHQVNQKNYILKK